MIRFIKTSVSKDDYQEIKQLGEKYIVHLEPKEDAESNTIECYEILVDGTPDMTVLQSALSEWKEYLKGKELSIAKKIKIAALTEYDESDNVNAFRITNHGEPMTDYWIPRDLRTSLEGDVIACSETSETYTFDIREMGISLKLNCTKFLSALSELRRYAFTAYNVTSTHMANINALTTKEDVENYDFTTGYPTKLTFEVTDLM